MATKKTKQLADDRINSVYAYTIDWLIDAEIRMIKQHKKDRLVSYLIGVVIGMAVGSLIVRAIL